MTFPQFSQAILIASFCIGSINVNGQNLPLQNKHAIGAQFIGLAFHPRAGTYPELFHLKLDPRAYFALELGVIAQHKYYFTNRLSMRSAAALYLDCAMVPAGFLHCGIGFELIKRGPHTLGFGLGPTLIFREDWRQFPQYVPDVIFRDRQFLNYQYRFYPGGDIEYAYLFHKNKEFYVSVIPGGMQVITTSLGFRYFL